MTQETTTIQHVSDTALWVAYYRAEETDRFDALFKDPFAKVLIGERGREIAKSMKESSRYTRWSVVVRTCIIDAYIRSLVAEGVDTVVNLGAGMDTRPYRLDLPKDVRWIEVDYPHTIEHKEKLLGTEIPRMQLERVALDLSDREKRKAFFAQIGAQTKNALIITEGVLPYLTEEQVATLAQDLHAEKNFNYWIGEYFAPQVYQYFRTNKRMEKLKNAPFRFFPAKWFDFFKQNGWQPKEIRYLAEESARLGRRQPLPWWVSLIRPFFSEQRKEFVRKMTAYVLYTKVN